MIFEAMLFYLFAAVMLGAALGVDLVVPNRAPVGRLAAVGTSVGGAAYIEDTTTGQPRGAATRASSSALGSSAPTPGS